MLGRFSGDGIVDRLGPTRTLQLGGAIGAVGFGLALLMPSPITSIIGFACAGWGVATAIPSAMHAADEVPGMKQGGGLTLVTWMMRLGMLIAPPIIGRVTDATSLATALWIVPIALAGLVLLAPTLRPRHAGQSADDVRA